MEMEDGKEIEMEKMRHLWLAWGPICRQFALAFATCEPYECMHACMHEGHVQG